MVQPARKIEWLVWAGLALIVVTLLLAVALAGLNLRRAIGTPLPVYNSVADFVLTNQNGRAVSLADMKGNVWVADIIFTRCAGPCPRVTKQMRELQLRLRAANANALLVTLTTDPAFDTPPVMKKYAERFQADQGNWLFLTGTKEQIAKLAVDSLKLTAVEKPAAERTSPEDLFIHTNMFVVVDKQGRLRGVVQNSSTDNPAQVQGQLISMVRRLQRES